MNTFIDIAKNPNETIIPKNLVRGSIGGAPTITVPAEPNIKMKSMKKTTETVIHITFFKNAMVSASFLVTNKVGPANVLPMLFGHL